MAYLGATFNNNESERKVMSGGPLPSGTYLAGIINTKQKETRKKDGLYLEVEFDIIEPTEYANRKIWDNINFKNPSLKTMEIAAEQLEDLRKACGIDELTDDEQLHNHMVQTEVIVEPAKPYIDQYGNEQPGSPSNRIIKYHHVDVDVEQAKANRKGARGTAPAKAAAPQTQQRPAQAQQQQARPVAQSAAGNAAPWKKNKPA